MKKTFFLSILAVLCFTACSSDDETPEDSIPRLLTVEVSENPMVDENGAARTRGTEITSGTLSEFSMNYQTNKYEFSKTGGTWNTNTWPTSVNGSTKIDFYAYNSGDGTFYYNNDNPYVNFTVDATPANQKDLLVATHKAISYNDAGGKVSLDFNHACAAVNFSVEQTTTLQKSMSTGVTVKSIQLVNVANTGQYYYNSNSWSEISGSADYTLTDSDNLTVGTVAQELACGTLFIIPQILGTDDSIRITYIKDNEKVALIPLSGTTWSAGTQYDITIKLGTTLIK